MLDTKLEENNGEKNNLRRTIDAIDGENNKVSYLANQKDNEEKLEFLKNFTEKESRDKIISSLEHKVSPDLFKIVYLAQRMIKEFIKDVYTSTPADKLEAIEITFNRTNIIFNKLPDNYNMEVDEESKTITIAENRRHNQNKLLGYVLHGYAHCFSNINKSENEDEILEEGNADIFVDLVVNNYIKKHPFESFGFHIDKNYSIESAYTEANSIIRTRMYVLEKLKIDKKMLLEFLLGDKEKYLKNIFNGVQKNDEFNLNEFYEKNKFALQDINRESIYYRKNAILPMYILQEKIVTENILEKEYSQLDLIKKRFNYERINKINADELDDFINIMQDTDRVKDNLAEFIATELNGLTDMEKRMSADNIIENVLVICKYKKINNDIAKQTLEIIQYLINDLERNVKFSTYAVPLIMGEIKRFLRDDGIVKVSRSLKEASYKIKREKEHYQKLYNREPTLKEISVTLDMDESDILMAMESGQEVCSLHQVIYQSEGDEIHLEDKLEQQADLIEQTVDNIYVQELLKKLNEQERQIIHMRYFQNQTQAAIAKKIGISQVQVSRMEKKILNKLRKNANTKEN